VNRFFRYKKTLAVSVLLAATLGVWFWRSAADNTEPPYRAARVQRGDIEVTVATTAAVQPRNRLEVKPPVTGRMEQIEVREGQSVRRGQLMAWMSSTERAALLDAASAKGPDELKRWEELYRATPIYAPLSGTVIVRNVEPGQTVAAQDAIFVLSDRLVLKAQVDETDIGQVRKGQKVYISWDSYPNETLSGVVDQIAHEAKNVNNVMSYAVYVVPERVPDFMRSGMTANVKFSVATRRNVLVVPTEAIRMQRRESQVLVPADDPKVEPPTRTVKVGLSDGPRTEILDGLAEGDTVLIARPKESTPVRGPIF
jgi:membrane fusion protein, macrolide-specific efflux system